MKLPIKVIRNVPKEGNDATAVEYCLMASFIAAVVVGTVTMLGGNVGGLLQTISSAWQ